MTIQLWLDDARPAPRGWIRARTAPEAISVLKSETVTEVSIDHDLGPPEAGTGYDVLLWIEDQVVTNDEFLVPVINIHTQNPVAGKKMIQTVHAIERMLEAKQRCADLE